MQKSAGQGVFLVLCAAVLWGSTGTAQSFAPLTLSPLLVGALRVSIAALFFAVYLLVTGRMRWLLLVGLPWRGIAAAGACMAIYNLCFFTGVRATGVAIGTAVAIGSGPIWAGLLQFAFAGQAPNAAWWWGSVLAVLGGCLMVLGGNAALHFSAWGLVACLASGLSYAAFALINKNLVHRAKPVPVTAAVFFVAAVLALPSALALAPSWTLAPAAWAVVAYLGVVATGVAYLLFSSGLRSISGATGVTLALGEPLTAFVLAQLVVGERPGVAAFAGLGLVLLGLALVIRSELRQSQIGALT